MQGIPFQSAKLNKILKIHSNTAETNTKPWYKPYNNTTIFLTFCWQIIFLVIGVEVGGDGGGGGKGRIQLLLSNQMAAVKFKGEGLYNHNPAWANRVHPTITFSNTEIVTETFSPKLRSLPPLYPFSLIR